MAEISRLKIAVVGTGISGLSAAWLLSRHHTVTIYEQADRAGGHSNTVQVESSGQKIPVDTGFIVFNRQTYPNLSALFANLEVPTQPSEMSFSASLEGGTFEYAGGDIAGLFAQRRNIVRPRFWRMLTGIARFYRNAVVDAQAPGFENLTLGQYLDAAGYSREFRDDHLLPMASAIWSASPADMLSYPALAFIHFHANHGLLQMTRRPQWETVTGGSISYVRRLLSSSASRIYLDRAAVQIVREAGAVALTDSRGRTEQFDHVVLGCHADQALGLLGNPTDDEAALLGTFRYQRNLAVLHSDPSFMPCRKAAWSSWNYMSESAGRERIFTYWMNRLQNLPGDVPLFVTLNPPRPPQAGTLHHSESYDHPLFDSAAIAAQKRLWSLQGVRRTWFCGAYFGAGFHEDGLQAGLAVAEDLGGIRRPWAVEAESGRITRLPRPPVARPEAAR